MNSVATDKDSLQQAAWNAWEINGRKGTIVGATGVGKSRIYVLEVVKMAKSGLIDSSNRALLTVPTEKLRDENWPEEFARWGHLDVFQQCVRPICYASLPKEKGNHFPLVGLDEVHWITENNSRPFTEIGDSDLIRFKTENIADAIMGLTATTPDKVRDPMKYTILNEVAPVVFIYSLAMALEDGIVPDFEIIVIMVPLDGTIKCIQAGTAKTPFMTTESAHYLYLQKKVTQASIAARNNPAKRKWADLCVFERNRFLATLPSKTRLIKALLDKHSEGLRTLVFCGGIEQSRELLGDNVFNSKDKSSNMLKAFKDGVIDKLGVVNAVNEGHNIPGIDQAVIGHSSTNERVLIQRLGRLLRFRENYKPRLYMTIVQGTQDEKTMVKILENIPKSKIRYEAVRSYM